MFKVHGPKSIDTQNTGRPKRPKTPFSTMRFDHRRNAFPHSKYIWGETVSIQSQTPYLTINVLTFG